jgi:type II secretory pathway pseudopilin PulG
MKDIRLQKGQSLVEMVVVIGMVILLTTGIVTGTTISLNRSKTSQYQTKALAYAQEGIEFARSTRDAGWTAFAAMGSASGTIYCVGSANPPVFVTGACSAPNISNFMTRNITFQLTTVSGVSTMKVTSQVTWGDTSNTSNAVQLTTYLTQWR